MKGFDLNINYNLVFLAGGPGLSSYSFKKLSPLREIAELHFYNPMGTVEPLNVVPSYDNLLNEIIDYIDPLENVILCGHSFGGIQAIDLASQDRKNIKGLISIASPVSADSFKILNENFSKFQTELGDMVTRELASNPSNEVYKKWYLHFKDFYFYPKHSQTMIEAITNDSVCVKNYIQAISTASEKEDSIQRLQNISIPKLLIYGEFDNVLPEQSAKSEAALGDFLLRKVNTSGHFPHYENSDQTIHIIKSFLQGELR